jgi:hypothetical protein
MMTTMLLLLLLMMMMSDDVLTGRKINNKGKDNGIAR